MEKKKKEDLLNDAKSLIEANKKEIIQSTAPGEKVVRISFDIISQISTTLSEGLLDHPEDTLSIMETALDESNLLGKGARIRITDSGIPILDAMHNTTIRRIPDEEVLKYQKKWLREPKKG